MRKRVWLPPPPVIDSSLLDRITALGISKTEAEDIFALQPEMTLRATLTLVEDRVKNAKLPALDSPAAFFKSALRHGYAAKKPVITKTPESVSVSKFRGRRPFKGSRKKRCKGQIPRA